MSLDDVAQQAPSHVDQPGGEDARVSGGGSQEPRFVDAQGYAPPMRSGSSTAGRARDSNAAHAVILALPKARATSAVERSSATAAPMRREIYPRAAGSARPTGSLGQHGPGAIAWVCSVKVATSQLVSGQRHRHLSHASTTGPSAGPEVSHPRPTPALGLGPRAAARTRRRRWWCLDQDPDPSG